MQKGWYVTKDSSNYLMFLFNGNGDWYAITASGDMTKCAYGYVEQGGELEMVAPIG